MIWNCFIFGCLLLGTITCLHEIDLENVIRARKPKSGRVVNLNPSNQKVVEMAKYSLKKFEYDTDSKVQHGVVKIIKATEQVVAGKLYKIHFHAHAMLCQSKLCAGEDSYYPLSCHSRLLLQPWLQESKLSVKCQELSDED